MAFYFHSLCIPVCGFIRSAIYDFQNNDYVFAPLEIESLLNSEEIDNYTKKYLRNLIEKKMIFEWPENIYEDTFFRLQLDSFDFPAIISNAVIELSSHSDIKLLIKKLDNISCTNVQFIFNESFGIDYINYFKQFISLVKQSALKHIEIAINYQFYRHCEYLLMEDDVLEIKRIFVFKVSTEQETMTCGNGNLTVSYFSNSFSFDIGQEKKCHVDFTVNTALFVESQTYNAYYNRKVFINSDGYVLNGPLTKKIHGNIFDPNFNICQIYKSDEFENLAKIKKDIISICNVCEFRFMCIDSRVPKKHTDSEGWYQDTECNYNPFIAKWQGEIDYKGLTECGVIVTEEKVIIDYGKLQLVVESIYNSHI